MNQQQLSVLLQLSSPSLPIGGFSYSQGFASAVDRGSIVDESSALLWIEEILLGVFSTCEGPLWILLYQAWQLQDVEKIRYWNQWFWASRETYELRMETEQMGWSLVKLAQELNWGQTEQLEMLKTLKPISLPCAHTYVANVHQLNIEDALTAYGFTWVENQVMAAIKSIPLGQVAGQRILQAMATPLEKMVEIAKMRANTLPPQIDTISCQLGILSARHETQYSRLFRS